MVGDEAIDRYLNGGVDQLYAPRLLPDMDKAVGILEEKISQGAPIRIVGDYDIDGVCSTCILFLGLRRLGNTKNLGLKALIQPISLLREKYPSTTLALSLVPV